MREAEEETICDMYLAIYEEIVTIAWMGGRRRVGGGKGGAGGGDRWRWWGRGDEGGWRVSRNGIRGEKNNRSQPI